VQKRWAPVLSEPHLGHRFTDWAAGVVIAALHALAENCSRSLAKNQAVGLRGRVRILLHASRWQGRPSVFGPALCSLRIQHTAQLATAKSFCELDRQFEARADLGEAVAKVESQAPDPRGLTGSTDLKLAPAAFAAKRSSCLDQELRYAR
jgi:hypothetical protein